ncbi:unnamed protein product [Paramecium sonneborni]|uniref:RING-type domain-containing protein n=1 Tax=Paramecium sonneborni TaxID=65129 RepID=A0A8S1KSW8_9CILI|nr:unnamed protein product [Paramecium sonneborni]
MLYIFLFSFCLADQEQFQQWKLTTTESMFTLNITLNLSHIDNEMQLRLYLSPQSNTTKSLLILCNSKPNITLFNIHSIKTLACIYDINSYYQNSTQVITLDNNPTSKEIRELFSIYYLYSNNPYIGIVSQGNENELILELKQMQKNQCAKNCQNNGKCLNGFCECPISFIGVDCSIQLKDIENQIILEPRQLYFFHIKSFNISKFERQLESFVDIKYTCQHQYQINFSGVQISTNLIILNQTFIQSCLMKTIEIQEQLSIKLQSYIIFELTSPNSVKILTIEKHYIFQNLIVAFIALLIIALFSMFYVFYHHKNPKDLKALRVVPIIKFSLAIESIEQSDIECALCMKEFQINQSVRITYCNHLYHDFCFKMWWTNNKSCPRCRSPLDLETMRKNQKTDIIQQSTFSNIQSNRKKNLVTFVDTGSAIRHMPMQQKLEFCIEIGINQKIEQNYQRVIGIQVFQIKNLTQNGLSEKSKITITLKHNDGELPILLLCNNKPNANMSLDYDSISKEQCQYDVNAYEVQNKKQVFSLQDKLRVGKYHKNYNIYEFQNTGLFVGAISKLQSSYSIQAEIQSIYTCQKECRNGGTCFYGICECLQGTFGDDCSLQGLNILDQQALSSNYLYYLDIQEIIGPNFLRILSNSIPIRQQCYADQPQVNHGTQVLTNLIQIDHQRIEYCKNITTQVQDQIKVQQIPYYLFKIQNQNNVEIFDNDVQEVVLSKQNYKVYNYRQKQFQLMLIYIYLLINFKKLKKLMFPTLIQMVNII